MRVSETTLTYSTNVFGAVSVIQEFLPLLHRSDAGRIVNVSSTMGSLTERSDPASPWYEVSVPAYISSKAALNAITVATEASRGEDGRRSAMLRQASPAARPRGAAARGR